MSGIVGIIHRRGESISPVLLKRMTDAIAIVDLIMRGITLIDRPGLVIDTLISTGLTQSPINRELTPSDVM
jgi:hypothetical protein